jgi:hypothetical protein
MSDGAKFMFTGHLLGGSIICSLSLIFRVAGIPDSR